MSVTFAPRSNDPRLAALLAAVTDAEAWLALDQLMIDDLAAIIRSAVVRRLGRSRQAAELIDDVVGEVRLKLTQKLWALRAGAGDPVENLAAYCATTSEYVSYAFLRRRFPERTRLRNRLRYALQHHPGLSLDADTSGVWHCRATTIREAGPSGATQAMLNTPGDFAAGRRINMASPLPALIHALLSACDTPVEFDRFVDVMATLLGVAETSTVVQPRESRAADRLEQIPDSAPGIQTVLEQRTTLLEVWQELGALPLRQRVALLLNLRDPEGGAILQLLPATGVVSMAEIATTLDVSAAELQALWDDLPLDDLAIARRLGLTRQQVINLRKSGRARLARKVR
jgi:hypothetical protein